MSDYVRYRDSKGLTNSQMVKAVSTSYPGYTKIQHTMVNNPDKYGVCLLPEAERLIVEAYGEGEGIKLPSTKSRDCKRKKRNRLVVRLNDEMYNRVRDLMLRLHYDTVQSFLEAALSSMVEQELAAKEE